MPPLPVICLAGPTGSGKTALAIALAKELDAEIINADSRQAYADFPLVTAQPDDEEKSAAPHHLYAFLDSREKLDACAWSKLAHEKVLELHSRGKKSLLVGGSGFYFRALLSPLPAIPAIPSGIAAFYAERIRISGSRALHGELEKIDPGYAARIHPNDRQRIQRALEVHAATGKTFSWWNDSARPDPLCAGPLFMLDCSLSDLEPRLKLRIEKMNGRGALAEIIRAWKKCPDRSAPAWSGIGCREGLDYLRGSLNWREWQSLWLANTRAYAKRQLTWFRGVGRALPIPAGNPEAILAHAALAPFRNPALFRD